MTTTLTATVDGASNRILLNLTWTTVTAALVQRVHADGTAWPIRAGAVGDGNVPILSTTGVGWVGYDHEVPLDAPVTYQATSTQAVGTTVTSSAITAISGGVAWLTHPIKPALGGRVVVRDDTDRTLTARRGVHQIIGRADPVAVWDVRASDAGGLIVQTSTAADITNLRALLADGAPLLYRTPSTWGGEWLYLAVGDVGLQRLDGLTATDVLRRWPLPYVAVSRPSGVSQGAVGVTYADVPVAYATYTALAAGEATYADLAIKPGP